MTATTDRHPSPKRFFVRTLGCPKNEVDSDGIAGLLTAQGHVQVPAAVQADVVIVNTCGFIDRSKQESVDTLLEYVHERVPGQQVIAAGCLVQRYKRELESEIPELDGLIGTREWDRIGDVVSSVQGTSPAALISPELPVMPVGPAYPRDVDRYPIASTRAIAGTSRASAYLKIADGCGRPCAFCIIPTIKGGFNSKPLDRIAAEARALAETGTQEIVLVAQDLTAYGFDRGERNALPRVIRTILESAPTLRWIRLMYAYPGSLTDDVIELMAERPQVLPYLDIPLQHGHDGMLRRMKRPGLRVTERLLERLRKRIPHVAIRTAFIVGFPGETDEEFETLVQFVKRHRFDRVGVFTYSREEGTPAAAVRGQVPAKVKRRRRDELMSVQQEISYEMNRSFVGGELDVLIEERVERVPVTKPSGGFRNGGFAELPFDAIGRSYRDAPEVDGVVLCRGEARPGEFVRVRITQALDYDLLGISFGSMANLVTLARVLLLFATVALLYFDDYRASLVAAFLTVVVILGDAVDGWVARHWGRPTEFGSIFDIAGDRVVENVYLVVYAHLGLIPIWMPLTVIARSFLVDSLRGMSFQQGRTAFGPRSMMVSTLGKWLSSSRASRAAYGVAKAVAFTALALWLALLRLGPESLPPLVGLLVPAIALTLTYAMVAFCLLRGALVLWDARGYLVDVSTSTPPVEPRPVGEPSAKHDTP